MWADEVRAKETTAWHYVNIPLNEDTYNPDGHCRKRQCVIGQIQRFRDVLANLAADIRKSQKYLIQFVGDPHQPLILAIITTAVGMMYRWRFWEKQLIPTTTSGESGS